MSVISFTNQDVKFKLSNKRLLKRWIFSVVEKLSSNNSDVSVGNVTFVFCSDDYLKDINIQYLNHDYFTDVITFDYSNENVISGDILISIDMVKINAIEYGVNFDNELYRVMIHGVLHLMGYNDYTNDDFDKMKVLEDRSLNILYSLL